MPADDIFVAQYDDIPPPKEEPKKDEVVDEEITPSPAEEKAREGGWVPRAEWVKQDKDPDDWVDAGEFNRRGELMARISSQSTQLRALQKSINELQGDRNDLSKALKALGEHNAKLAEAEYKKAVRDLRSQRAAAIRDGEDDHVAVLEEQMEELEEARRELKEDRTPEKDSDKPRRVDPDETTEYFKEWVAKPENEWYSKDLALRGAADAIGVDLYNNKGITDLQELFAEVEKQVKESFPEKFKKTSRRPVAGRVAEPDPNGNRSTRVPRSKFTAADLTDEERQIANTYVREGALASVQEYVDQLAEINYFSDR